MKRTILIGIVFGICSPLIAHAQQAGGVPSLAQQVQTLQQQVATLITANTTLQTTVTNLQTTISTNDTLLQTALAAETQARKDADSTLQSLIAAGLGGQVYSNRNLNLRTLPTQTPLATLQLPAGSYLIFGQALLELVADGNGAVCFVTKDGDPIAFTEFQISPIYQNIVAVIAGGANAVLGGVDLTPEFSTR